MYEMATSLVESNITFSDIDLAASLRLGSKISSLKMVENRVLAVIPYRNQPRDLLTFLLYMPTYFYYRNMKMDLILVEQSGNSPFNRGKLFNAAIRELDKANSEMNLKDRLAGHDCLVYHDIDKIPIHIKVPYVCKPGPHNLVRELLHINGTYG